MDLHQRGWLGWATLFAIALSVNSLSKHDMFDYGEQAGDQLLEQGTDQTQALILNQSMFFFDGAYDTVYVSIIMFYAHAKIVAKLYTRIAGKYINSKHAQPSIMIFTCMLAVENPFLCIHCDRLFYP